MEAMTCKRIDIVRGFDDRAVKAQIGFDQQVLRIVLGLAGVVVVRARIAARSASVRRTAANRAAVVSIMARTS